MLTFLTALSLVIWLALTFGWQRFWLRDQMLDGDAPPPTVWPRVVAVVPARNEEETIERCLASLANQDYPGPFSIIISNDSSTDGTEAAALRAAGHFDGINVVNAAPLEAGWAGKMWALSQGIEQGRQSSPDYYWFSDADIVHGPSVLSQLVAKSEADRLAMTSLMVKLRCRQFWEKLLVPAFLYFFTLLYPFRAVNDPSSSIAGAAGGCVLLRRGALEAIGGIEAIKGAVIDDCTLARAVKVSGRRIWLGFAGQSRSLRSYGKLGDFWQMVTRSAYVQLNFSPVLLFGTTLGLAMTFLAPPALVLSALALQTPGALWAGLACLLLVITYVPTTNYCGISLPWSLTLPLAAVLFGAMTLHSALQHHVGKAGTWRGRDLH